jgi:hypothetical protein
MSMLAIVGATSSEVVPVGFASKMALFDAIGVHVQGPPPDELDQFAPVLHAPPTLIR